MDRWPHFLKFDPFQIQAVTQQNVTKVEGCEYFLKALSMSHDCRSLGHHIDMRLLQCCRGLFTQWCRGIVFRYSLCMNLGSKPVHENLLFLKEIMRLWTYTSFWLTLWQKQSCSQFYPVLVLSWRMDRVSKQQGQQHIVVVVSTTTTTTTWLQYWFF